MEIAELITSVNIALGVAPLSRCEEVDSDESGSVSIDELVGAVQSALTQCGRVTPTPMATRTRTATRTPSPTPQLAGEDAVEASSNVAVQTVESFELLDFGFIGSGGGGGGAGLGQGAGALTGDLCPDGGGAERRCDVAGRTATLRITFDGCRTLTASRHAVVRDGRLTMVVEDPEFCDTGVVADSAAVTRVFEGFRQIESGAPGGQLAVIAADLKDTFEPTGVGCAGPEGRETIDGTLTVQCSPAAESIDCARGSADVTLRPVALVLQRASGGFPCLRRIEANGVLDVDDRLDKEQFVQSLRDFVLTELPGSNGETLVTLDGDMSIDCLGAIHFDTKTAVGDGGPLVFPDTSRCPVGGEIELSRPLGDGGGGAGTPDPGFRQRLFRAANGQVYQVLQNAGSDADKGAEAIRVTTLVGSTAGSVRQCAAAGGPTTDPQAVTGAPPGQALPLSAVFKSERIDDAGAPCFNEDDNGRVCIGPRCANDCSCRTGNCATFGIADGTPITTGGDVPRATLVPGLGPIDAPCDGLTGSATWRFGTGGPTTQIAQCAATPRDGFPLPVAASEFTGGTPGSTIIFAYDTPLLSAFSAGAAGFPIDVDGSNPVGCSGTNRVLNLGRAVLDAVPGPRFIYNPNGGVGFDFDGDGRIDRSDPSCRTGALAGCDR